MSVLIALHALAAVIWVGGLFFLVGILRPAASSVPLAERLPLLSTAMGRFFLWVWIAIIVLLVTGNTVIDALLHVAEQPYDWANGPLKSVDPDQPIVLITAHRRESFGDTFRGMCRALASLGTQFPDTQFIYPVHLNPNVQQPVKEILDKCNNVQLLPPLDYVALVQLMKASRLVITDSGGIQEEAPGLKVPVIVMRETTERPEGVDAGVVRLVGTSESSIVKAAVNLLESQEEREKMRSGINPYGDGHAAARIVSAVLDAS